MLAKLYAGDLLPAENRIKGSREYDALCRQSLREIEEFTEKLDEETQKEFEALMEHYLELTYMEKTQTFCDGFRIGAAIMCEVFGGADREAAG
ncbi:hypothetical protein LIZ87_13120 [Lacrimispora sp. 210928-DFI.3.58]|nr:hypothetical protein [Lacrimispora sp. 210928-DFI.3.58]